MSAFPFARILTPAMEALVILIYSRRLKVQKWKQLLAKLIEIVPDFDN